MALLTSGTRKIRRKSIFVRTRRQVKRGLRRSRIGRPVSNDVYHYKRWSDSFTVTGSGMDANGIIQMNATGQFFGLTFALSDLPGVSDFTNLYDQFKINKVVFIMIPTMGDQPVNGNNTITPGGAGLSFLQRAVVYTKDYNDVTAPASQDELQEYAKAKYHRFVQGKPLKIILTPACQTMTYRTAISTGYRPSFKQWINMTDTITPHYGIKVATGGFGAGTAYAGGITAYECKWCCYFSCKNVK